MSEKSHVHYMVSMIFMFFIGMVMVAAIFFFRPEQDNTQLIATVLGFVATTTASILALMKSQETHLTVNSQLQEWKRDFGALKRAEGAQEGIVGEQQRVALLLDKVNIQGAVVRADRDHDTIINSLGNIERRKPRPSKQPIKRKR